MIIASALQQKGLPSRTPVILQISTLSSNFTCWWGCVLIGLIPVNVAMLTNYNPDNPSIRKLLNVWEDLNHPPIITDAVEQLLLICNGKPVQIISTQELFKTTYSKPTLYTAAPTDVMFYQLTSGSTGKSKVIQETHEGIIAHIHASTIHNEYSSSNITLNWLPVDHIVPMLTVHLKDIFLGCYEIQVNTTYIIRNSLVWLDLMDEQRVTHSWSPNFGFNLVVKALQGSHTRKTWNLSCIEYLMNAGEQVTLATCKAFMEMLAPFGLRSNAMQPSFGMAELCTCITYANDFNANTAARTINRSSFQNVIIVLDTPTHTADEVTLIDLGPPTPGTQIRIANSSNQTVQEGMVGRVQFRGPFVTPGYLNNPQANAEAFLDQGWFNSGDMGFLLKGRLTITGREKEAMRIRGTDYFCFDIEGEVGEVVGVKPGLVGACSTQAKNTTTESMAIFYVPSHYPTLKIEMDIRERIVKFFGINPDFIIPINEKSFPKTTSGKIQRGQLKMLVKDYQSTIFQSKGLCYTKSWEKVSHIQQQFDQRMKRMLLFSNNVTKSMISNSLQILAGEEFSRLSSSSFVINPYSVKDYDRLLDETTNFNAEIILFLWPAEHVLEHSDAELYPSLWPCFHLLCAISQYKKASGFRVFIITRGATNNPTLEGIKDSPLWGLARSWNIENSKNWGGIIDLDPEQSISVQLPHLLSLVLDTTRCSLRQQSVYRFQISSMELPFSNPLNQLGGIFIITGGCGGLGLQLAIFLGNLGFEKVVLLSRKPPQANVREILQSISTNTKYEFYCVDVANEEHLKAILQKLSAETPIRGVFHLAGILVENTYDGEISSELSSAVNSKIKGAWNLHQLTKENQDLQYFVLYSSMSSVIGSSHLGIYAAAQAFLDELAAFRTNIGLPTITINWGPWAQIGMVAQKKWELTRFGLNPLQVENAMHVFDGLLRNQSSAIVMNMNWNTFGKFFSHCNLDHLEQFVKLNQTPDTLKHNCNILEVLTEMTRQILELSSSYTIDTDQNLVSMGFDSLTSQQFFSKIVETFGPQEQSILYAAPTLQKLAQLISEGMPIPIPIEADQIQTSVDQQQEIAIIGMGTRYPGGDSPQEFWNLLINGCCAIGMPSKERKNLCKFDDNTAGAYVDNVAMFDNAYFNLTAAEATELDPQHRLLLEVCSETLQNSGYSSQSLWGSKTGVWIGMHYSDYAELNPNANTYVSIGTSPSTSSGRVSFFHNWKGPSMTVMTACSSSLVAVHLAVESLRAGKCTMAIAGGVQLNLSTQPWNSLSKLGILSPNHLSKPFDASAGGIVRGEGCGIVLLKPLQFAIRDRDNILAVIAGSSVNHNGHNHSLLTPNPISQRDVIFDALNDARIMPSQVSYIEAHGTGTCKGDAMELESISSIYSSSNLFIGSVKANIGHLEAASGIAALHKSILCMLNGQIPPQINVEEPNQVLIDHPNLQLPMTTVQLPKDAVIGISSFGYSGTNCHIILKNWQAKNRGSGQKHPFYVATISAKSEKMLVEFAKLLGDFVRVDKPYSLGDICYTINMRRDHFPFRLAIPVTDIYELQTKLIKVSPSDVTRVTKQPKLGLILDDNFELPEMIWDDPCFAESVQETARMCNLCVDDAHLAISAGNTPAILVRNAAFLRTLQKYGINPVIHCNKLGIIPIIYLSGQKAATSLETLMDEKYMEGVDWNSLSFSLTSTSTLSYQTENVSFSSILEAFTQAGCSLIVGNFHGKHLLKEGMVQLQWWPMLLGTLYSHGLHIDWSKFFSGNEQVVADLPYHPFHRKWFWFNHMNHSEEEDAGVHSKVFAALQCIGIDIKHVPLDQPLVQTFGLDSLAAIHFAQNLSKQLSIDIPNSFLFNFPTINSILQQLQHNPIKPLTNSEQTNTSATSLQKEQIAIVGMACRYPNARNIDEFWELLKNKTDVIKEIPSNRWDINDPNIRCCKYGGFIDEVDKFDASHFRISPEEAIAMDPQQRLLLEVTEEALLDAGLDPKGLVDSLTGVFIGITNFDYMFLAKKYEHQSVFTGTGCSPSIASGRISYLFGFKGPTMTIDTACSSSLYAISTACDKLNNLSCNLAIAGGVNLILTPDTSIILSKMNILSQDGRCKTFSASADGYGRSEGCGIVALKRLSDAIAEGDRIYGVILSTATNQDGRSAALTAPNGPSQTTLISSALSNAGISPESVDIIETHGTGTILGDSIEVNSLNEALCTEKRISPLYISAVKSNIGHAESAAGVAGLIKATLSIYHRVLPPNLHASCINPKLDVAPCMVFPTDLIDLPKDRNLIAGVNSFGWSGSNAHILISTYFQQNQSKKRLPPPQWSRKSFWFRLDSSISGHSVSESTNLRGVEVTPFFSSKFFMPIIRYKFEQVTGISVADANANLLDITNDSLHLTAFADVIGTALDIKVTVSDLFNNPNMNKLCDWLFGEHAQSFSKEKLKSILILSAQAAVYLTMGESAKDLFHFYLNDINICDKKQSSSKTAICFPGLGSQFIGMSAGFRSSSSLALFAKASSIVGYDLLSICLHGPQSKLDDLAVSQVAILVCSLAEVEEMRQKKDLQLLDATAVVGLSLGEYTALVVAGVLSFEDAVELVNVRGAAMKSAISASGVATGMLCILGQTKEKIQELLFHYPQTSIANYLSPQMFTVAGPLSDLRTIMQQGYKCTLLKINGACHSKYLEAGAAVLATKIKSITFRQPKLRIVSNVDGRDHSNPEEIRELLIQHMISPVLWQQSIELLLAQQFSTFVEIGQGQTLHRIVKEIRNHWLASNRVNS